MKREIQIPNIDKTKIPGKVLFETIVGDHLYGIKTNAKTQIKGVYIAEKAKFFDRSYPRIFTNIQGIDYYELGCFIDLLMRGDIQAMEMLFAPKSLHITCDEIFNIHVLGKKLAFITGNFYNNVLSYVENSLTTVQMHMETFKEFYSEVRTKKSIDVNDYIYMMTPTTNLSFVRTFNDYLKTKRTKEQSHFSNYISLPSKMADNIRYVYFVASLDGVYGIVNQITGELHKYEEDKKLSKLATKAIPVGIICYDKNRFQRESGHFTFKFDIVKDISKEKDSNWKLDVYQKNDIFYDSTKIMHSIRLLNIILDNLENRAGIKIVPGQSESEMLRSILEGDIPFKTLYFDITEKLLLIKKKERSFPMAKPIALLAHSMEFPIRSTEYNRTEMVNRFKAIENTGSDLEDEESRSIIDVDAEWTD